MTKATEVQLAQMADAAHPIALEIIQRGETAPELLWKMARALAAAYEDAAPTPEAKS